MKPIPEVMRQGIADHEEYRRHGRIFRGSFSFGNGHDENCQGNPLTMPGILKLLPHSPPLLNSSVRQRNPGPGGPSVMKHREGLRLYF